MVKRLRLLLGFVLLLFSVFSFPAFADDHHILLSLPANANVANAVASIGGGVQVGAVFSSQEGLLLHLIVPAVPNCSSNSTIRFCEEITLTSLPSNPHARCWVTAPQTADASWYKTQPSFRLINLNNALPHATGRGLVVAVIDSLMDYSHPALAGHLTNGYDFVIRNQGGIILNDSSAGYLDDSSAGYLDQATITYLNDSSAGYLDDSSAGYLDSQPPAWSHATSVGSIIAAIATDAMIMPVVAFGPNGSSDTLTIAKAIIWAVDNGAQVINMSFGTEDTSKVMRKAITYALDHSVTLVASAGNNNTSLTSVPQYPAAYSGVISTAATNLQDVKASFSNYGPTIVMDAPGVNIISAVPGNLYGCMSGTSFSAPIIAGTAALVRSEGVTSVTQPITSGAINIDAQNPAYTGQLGKRVDVRNSVN